MTTYISLRITSSVRRHCVILAVCCLRNGCEDRCRCGVDWESENMVNPKNDAFAVLGQTKENFMLATIFELQHFQSFLKPTSTEWPCLCVL